MDFPIVDLMDQDACYAKLLAIPHPDGLACPRCHSTRLSVHRRHRPPVLDHRCRDCRRAFNAFTGTALQGTNRRPSTLVLILRGVAQDVPTAQPPRELDCDRMKRLEPRHKPQADALGGADATRRPRPMRATSMRGGKGVPHREPADPPRRRANKRRGHGTFANDRPPVAATISRESGRACWDVVKNSNRTTLEGTRTGLRNFLRPFRGVGKWYLAGYVAMFEWRSNIKGATHDFLALLLGRHRSTVQES